MSIVAAGKAAAAAAPSPDAAGRRSLLQEGEEAPSREWTQTDGLTALSFLFFVRLFFFFLRTRGCCCLFLLLFPFLHHAAFPPPPKSFLTLLLSQDHLLLVPPSSTSAAADHFSSSSFLFAPPHLPARRLVGQVGPRQGEKGSVQNFPCAKKNRTSHFGPCRKTQRERESKPYFHALLSVTLTVLSLSPAVTLGVTKRGRTNLHVQSVSSPFSIGPAAFASHTQHEALSRKAPIHQSLLLFFFFPCLFS